MIEQKTSAPLPPLKLSKLEGPTAPERFAQALQAAKSALSPAAAAGVNGRSLDALQKYSHLFLSADGKTGGGVQNGEVKSVFNIGAKGFGAAAARQIALDAPVTHAITFGRKIGVVYEKAGFSCVATYPWSGQINPPRAWPEDAEKPDLHVYAWDPKKRLTTAPRQEADYHGAMRAVDDALAGHAPKIQAVAGKSRIFIVGAGVYGLFTARAAVKNGHQVTVFEQAAEIPNPMGASADRSRIIREAYGDDSGHARKAQKAFEKWSEVWTELGADHYRPRGTLITSHSAGDRAEGFKAGLDRNGQRYEYLTPAQATKQFPFLKPDALRFALHLPTGGVLLAQKIMQDLQAWLAQEGVVFRPNTRIESAASRGARGVVLTTADQERFVADSVIFTIGPWNRQQFPQRAADTGMIASRTIVAYLKPPAEHRQAWEKAPVMMVGGTSPGYVLPTVAGEAGLKVGAAFIKRPSDDLNATPPHGAQDAQTLRDNFAHVFADIGQYEVADMVSCPISFTRDNLFHAAPLPGVPDGRQGFSLEADNGEGFKLAPVIGEDAIAALQTGDLQQLSRTMRGEA